MQIRAVRLGCAASFWNGTRMRSARLKAYADAVDDAEVETRNAILEESVDAILDFVRRDGRQTFPFIFTRISDFAVVPYRQDQSPRLDFWGSDARNLTTEGDTRWVNYNMSHFSSRSTAS